MKPARQHQPVAHTQRERETRKWSWSLSTEGILPSGTKTELRSGVLVSTGALGGVIEKRKNYIAHLSLLLYGSANPTLDAVGQKGKKAFASATSRHCFLYSFFLPYYTPPPLAVSICLYLCICLYLVFLTLASILEEVALLSRLYYSHS